jgi:hypothetical protein
MLGRGKEEPSPQSLVGDTTLSATVAPAPPDAGEPAAGPGEGPLLFLFVLLTLAASAYVLYKAEHRALHDPKEKAARGEIQGLDRQSLFVPANLRRALAKIDAGDHPLISTIRVAADRVNATARDSDGNRRVLTIDPGFGVDSSDFGVGEDYAVRSDRVDADAPERMVRAVVRRTGLPAAAVDYVTMSFSEGSAPSWYIALKQGPARVRQWVAEADGTDLRKPGELSTAQKRANRSQQRALERQRRRSELLFQGRSACLQKARTAEAASTCLEKYAP